MRTTPVVIRLECGHLANATRQPLLPVRGSFRCGQCGETRRVVEDVTHQAVGNMLARFASAVQGTEDRDALVEEWIPEVFSALQFPGQRHHGLPTYWG